MSNEQIKVLVDQLKDTAESIAELTNNRFSGNVEIFIKPTKEYAYDEFGYKFSRAGAERFTEELKKLGLVKCQDFHMVSDEWYRRFCLNCDEDKFERRFVLEIRYHNRKTHEERRAELLAALAALDESERIENLTQEDSEDE